MDSGREFGFLSESIVQLIPGTLENGGENQGPGLIDTPGRANEDDYKAPNTSNPNYYQQQTLDQSNSGPPFKKSRHMQLGDSRSTNRSRVMGQILFKTKLCCKFQTGSCSSYTNCNFAHSLEELRVPPPNWQEIVAAATAHEEDCVGLPAEVIGSSSFSIEAAQRSHKGRACKRFNSVEGCPFGDYCKYVHNKKFKERESVVISLGPTSNAQDGGGGNDSGVGGGGSGGASWMASRPLNWKTRICNKWELTGKCPFGNKCKFAHGFEELHRYGGGRLIDTYARDPSAAPSNTSADPLVHRSNIGAPSQGPASITQRTGRKPGEKWKGPDKISLIYGDWIGDLE